MGLLDSLLIVHSIGSMALFHPYDRRLLFIYCIRSLVLSFSFVSPHIIIFLVTISISSCDLCRTLDVACVYFMITAGWQSH